MPKHLVTQQLRSTRNLLGSWCGVELSLECSSLVANGRTLSGHANQRGARNSMCYGREPWIHCVIAHIKYPRFTIAWGAAGLSVDALRGGLGIVGGLTSRACLSKPVGDAIFLVPMCVLEQLVRAEVMPQAMDWDVQRRSQSRDCQWLRSPC